MTAAVDVQRYRETIGHFATGVAVVTAHGEEGPAGMPPTRCARCRSIHCCCWCVLSAQPARCRWSRSPERFAVNVLRHEQHALSGVFASKAPEREFQGVPWRLHEGAPVLEEALAWLVCELRETHAGGDHTICVGSVIDMHYSPKGQPLVWYQGRYGTLGDEVPAEANFPN